MGTMVTMRAVKTGPRSLDLGVSLVAGLITGSGSVKTVAAWVPHDAIILLAAAQGVMLLARRRVPTAVLAGTTAVGVLMIVAGYPDGSAIFGACCAAYAVAVYGSGDAGAELVVTLRHAAVVAVAAITLGVASVAPGARGQSISPNSRPVPRNWRPRKASAPPGRSSTSGCGLPASCTTSSATRSASSRSRRRPRRVPCARTRTRYRDT